MAKMHPSALLGEEKWCRGNSVAAQQMVHELAIQCMSELCALGQDMISLSLPLSGEKEGNGKELTQWSSPTCQRA